MRSDADMKARGSRESKVVAVSREPLAARELSYVRHPDGRCALEAGAVAKLAVELDEDGSESSNDLQYIQSWVEIEMACRSPSGRGESAAKQLRADVAEQLRKLAPECVAIPGQLQGGIRPVQLLWRQPSALLGGGDGQAGRLCLRARLLCMAATPAKAGPEELCAALLADLVDSTDARLALSGETPEFEAALRGTTSLGLPARAVVHLPGGAKATCYVAWPETEAAAQERLSRVVAGAVRVEPREQNTPPQPRRPAGKFAPLRRLEVVLVAVLAVAVAMVASVAAWR